MKDVKSQIPLVDRKQELEELKHQLENSTHGSGNLLLIAGEAGVGKTRLLNEIIGFAQSQGVDIFQGWSFYESLTPYMPFMEALGSGGLENLFADETPRVETAYLMTHSGLLIKDVKRRETELNPDIFAGMLSAVDIFVKDSLSMLSGEEKKESLNSLGYENYRILIESGENANLVVILTGKENEFLINEMKDILVDVEQQYGSVLKSWDGGDKSVSGIENLIQPLITSGKYDGIDYAKDDPKIRRNRLFENILLGIERHAKVHPSLLCIEDLQWADPSTLALMHYVSRNTRECNLLILGTYRPEDVAATKDGKVHQLIEAKQLMGREELYQEIELGRLDEGYMDDILNSLLGRTDFADEFKTQLYRETEGNPFFIVELVRLLVDERTIAMRDNVWMLEKDLKEANMPSKVHDVIVRRLNRVGDEGREILDYAAVMGEEFTSDILVSATKLQTIDLLKQLRSLEQKHKLIRSLEAKFKFDHAKIKEVLYNEIPNELRTEYHSIIAACIEEQNKDNLDEVIGDLAFHYYRCQKKEKALPYILKAAEKATGQHAPHEAFEYYRCALDVVETMGDSLDNKKKKLEIIMALGNNCYLRGEWDSALGYYHRATGLSEEVGDEKRMAEGFRNIGLIYKNRNEWEKAILFFNKGVELSEKIDDSQRMADISYYLGGIYDEKGELDEARKYFGKCMDIAVNIGDSPEIADAYLGIGRIHARKSDYDKSIDFIKKAVEILKKTQDLGELSKAYANLGATFNQVDVNEAIKYHKKSIEIADKIRYVRIKGYGLMNIAYSYIKKNELEKASSSLDKALEIFNKLGERMPMSMTYINYGSIYRLQREWELAADYFEKALAICRELDTPYNLGYGLFEYGLLHKDKGDVNQAIERLTRALDIFKNIQNKEMIEKVEKELSALRPRS
ncbi:MAG: tetratricopeptide repeat protein [Thermoplasmata archaeon]|nr:MAG: tetratricopeptide repeat protein [Thermoplasmata archaeon]